MPYASGTTPRLNMKKLIALLILTSALSLSAATYLQPTNPPAKVLLGWTENPDPIVTGYRVYWGVATRSYTNFVAVGTTNVAAVTGLTRGTQYYFAATSVASNAVETLESVFSGEAIWTPPVPPAPPSGFGASNTTVRVTLQMAPTPLGPWTTYAMLGTATDSPGFYRSMVSISSAPPELLGMRKVQVLKSPKAEAE